MGGTSEVGLVGLAVMGQNFALNIAEKGFSISVYNRTASKVDETVDRAKHEGDLPLRGFKDPASFVESLKTPRVVIILVKAGQAVDDTIQLLSGYLQEGDCIIDGGNEWYQNTERRAAALAGKKLLYIGMGISGGEDGARNGPSLMLGGSEEAYNSTKKMWEKVAAQVVDDEKNLVSPCVAYAGKGGAGNFVKMVHNGIEYADMQLISEAYDVMKSVLGLTNQELHEAFSQWNEGDDLQSFLIEITAEIFSVKDGRGMGELVDKVLDKTGMKGTGKWTVQQAAELCVAAPTIAASLDSRFLSGLKHERQAAARIYREAGIPKILVAARNDNMDKKQVIDDVSKALYASKICSYAQGMNILRAKSKEQNWGLKLGEVARIWKGGCIIRAVFLDKIKQAYEDDEDRPSLLVHKEFTGKMVEYHEAWRRVVNLAVNAGISIPGMSASLAYFDTYRRDRLPANLIQAQRDYFGAHTYQRVDGQLDACFHTEWRKLAHS